jgi:hypothetical protein
VTSSGIAEFSLPLAATNFDHASPEAEFYLARVLPSSEDRMLVIDLSTSETARRAARARSAT